MEEKDIYGAFGFGEGVDGGYERAEKSNETKLNAVHRTLNGHI